MLNDLTWAAVIVGVAIVFAALLIGYFGVLREWGVRTGETAGHASRAAATAAEDLHLLESFASTGMVSASGSDSYSQREGATPLGTADERLAKS